MAVALAPGLERRLKAEIAGDVLFDRFARGRYATDASHYQVMPVGVVVPRDLASAERALELARQEGVSVLPRGGGTSQCGQTVNRAIVLDFSKHLRRMLSVDPEARVALVEPGIVLNHLNTVLRPHGLFFPVDPSTHARCTIGGMAGNNSCGAKSIRYGLMADNVRAIDAILADGTRYRFGAVPDNAGAPARIAELVRCLRALGAAEADEITARFPKVLRRVGGYNLDTLADPHPNLARLLVGSEGTLALSAAIELTLHPIKPRKVLGICQFPTFRTAMEAWLRTHEVEETTRASYEQYARVHLYPAFGDVPIGKSTPDCWRSSTPSSAAAVTAATAARGSSTALRARMSAGR